MGAVMVVVLAMIMVMGFYVARSKAQALTQARQLLRFGGAGHSAAIHARASARPASSCSSDRDVEDASWP